MQFTVRAPGKVILFGEHAVVHGVPALAASVGLHTYLYVEPSEEDGTIELDFPQVNLTARWEVKSLPWDSVKNHGLHRIPSLEVISALSRLLENVGDPFEHAACTAFLYLYLHLCSPGTKSYRFHTKSTLPIGAGLGSSASYSVCLAAAMLQVSNQPSSSLIVNDWSFLGESCIHGSPSGIDNLVSAVGGAVLYQRILDGPPKVRQIQLGSIPLILTDTAVPRQTSELVSGVGLLLSTWQHVTNTLFEAIRCVVDAATKLVEETAIRGEPDSEVVARLGQLARINHGLLVSLGVSHPSLERVREVADALGIGATKLTGAGGGGCAITIANSTGHAQALAAELGSPFKVFETTLGGAGVRIAQGHAFDDHQAGIEWLRPEETNF